jgi:hypothetical protein
MFQGTRAAVLAAVAAALVWAPAARAQEEESDGLPVEIRAVAAHVPVKTDARALEAYAKLIPKGLGWPAKPEVALWLAELSVPKSAPGRPNDDGAHWLEGAIDIRVRHGADEGWYPVHYPVTAEFWWHAGRAVGLPKRRADASIVQDGNGWTAAVTPRGTGVTSYSLEWKPDPSADPAAVDRAFHLPTAPMFPLNAAFAGPDLMRVQYFLRPPTPAQTAIPTSAPPYSSKAKADPGRVRVRMFSDIDSVNEDLPKIFGGFKLGDIVELDQTVPGSHAFYSLTLGSESEAIGQGSYPGDAKPGAGGGEPKDKPAKPTRCTRAQALTVGFRASQSGRLHSARAWADGRRIGDRLVGYNRVRVNLRKLRRPGTHRIKVVGYGTYGRSVKVTRTVRLCG